MRRDREIERRDRKIKTTQTSTRRHHHHHADTKVYLAIVAHVKVSAVTAAHTRPILPRPSVARFAQPNFIALAFTGIYNLIYHFLQSVLVAQSVLVECLCFYWWLISDELIIDVGDCELNLCCGLWCFFFFFFFAFLLFGFVTLCHSMFVTLSLLFLYYIDKRERARERESRVCRDYSGESD